MPSEEAVVQARERAIPVLDAWMAGFNALDLQAWKATMHFPHFRLASESCTDGKTRIWTVSLLRV